MCASGFPSLPRSKSLSSLCKKDSRIGTQPSCSFFLLHFHPAKSIRLHSGPRRGHAEHLTKRGLDSASLIALKTQRAGITPYWALDVVIGNFMAARPRPLGRWNLNKIKGVGSRGGESFRSAHFACRSLIFLPDLQESSGCFFSKSASFFPTLRRTPFLVWGCPVNSFARARLANRSATHSAKALQRPSGLARLEKEGPP